MKDIKLFLDTLAEDQGFDYWDEYFNSLSRIRQYDVICRALQTYSQLTGAKNKCSFIVLFQASGKGVFVESEYKGFLTTFKTFEEAEQYAKENIDNEHRFDYKIYQLVN